MTDDLITDGASDGPSDGASDGASDGLAPAQRMERARSLLGWVRWVGLADAVLLVVLLAASLTDNELGVSVLGPIHGVGYLVLMGLVVLGAFNRLWGWWFPALVFVTAGAIGSLAGEWRLRSQLAEPPAQP